MLLGVLRICVSVVGLSTTKSKRRDVMTFGVAM